MLTDDEIPLDKQLSTPTDTQFFVVHLALEEGWCVEDQYPGGRIPPQHQLFLYDILQQSRRHAGRPLLHAWRHGWRKEQGWIKLHAKRLCHHSQETSVQIDQKPGTRCYCARLQSVHTSDLPWSLTGLLSCAYDSSAAMVSSLSSLTTIPRPFSPIMMRAIVYTSRDEFGKGTWHLWMGGYRWHVNFTVYITTERARLCFVGLLFHRDYFRLWGFSFIVSYTYVGLK